MDLELSYADQTEIPAGMEALYTEKDGKFVFSAIKSFRTSDDVAKLQTALNKERSDHKATKAKYTKFDALGEIDPDQYAADMSELASLRELGEAGKNPSKAKLDELVNAEIARKVTPLQRELDVVKKERDEFKSAADNATGEIRSTKIKDAARAAALELGVQSTAIDDVLLYAERQLELTDEGDVITRELKDVKPGLTPKDWLTDMQNARPHWWPASQGGGARGGKGGESIDKNPWSADHWSMTAQGAYYTKHGEAKARAAAEAAGSFIGATAPKKA